MNQTYANLDEYQSHLMDAVPILESLKAFLPTQTQRLYQIAGNLEDIVHELTELKQMHQYPN